MLKDLGRIAAGAASIPVGAVAGALHRMSTGSRAMLDVTVTHWDDLLMRQHVLRRLRRAALDPAVVAVLFRMDGPPGSWAACQDLRAAIARLKGSGTATYAHLEAPGNAETWLAAACDRVFLVPTGQVGLVGVGVELTFLGEALRRVGVEPDFEAAGAYKAFGEAYTRSFASPENQEAVRALVDDMHAQLVRDVASGRQLDEDVVAALLERAPLSGEEAIEAGLVDQLAYRDEIEEWIEEHHGKPVKKVKFGQWARREALVEWIEQWGAGGKQIAVVHLEGPIVMDDRSGASLIRARSVVPALRALHDSDDVAAVVLHVNSPGGSALASDVIWREVDRLRHDKPVVACFEDVAASGGYYLSAPASEIFARPGTLTGSIGVFGGKLVMARTMRHLGVHTQEVTSAPNATVFSATRRFTPDQRDRFRLSLQRFYDGFVDRVAAGRRQPPESIEPHCRGRVWTGQLARTRGLVDRHGDLFDAVERARILSGLHVGGFREVDVSPRPRRSLFTRIVQRAMRDARPGTGFAAWLDVAVGRFLTPVMEVVLRHAGEPLALLPFDLRPR